MIRMTAPRLLGVPWNRLEFREPLFKRVLVENDFICAIEEESIIQEWLTAWYADEGRPSYTDTPPDPQEHHQIDTPAGGDGRYLVVLPSVRIPHLDGMLSVPYHDGVKRHRQKSPQDILQNTPNQVFGQESSTRFSTVWPNPPKPFIGCPGVFGGGGSAMREKFRPG